MNKRLLILGLTLSVLVVASAYPRVDAQEQYNYANEQDNEMDVEIARYIIDVYCGYNIVTLQLNFDSQLAEMERVKALFQSLLAMTER